jgi:hypothetical protein
MASASSGKDQYADRRQDAPNAVDRPSRRHCAPEVPNRRQDAPKAVGRSLGRPRATRVLNLKHEQTVWLLCSYHLKGKCNRGDTCKFAHDIHSLFVMNSEKQAQRNWFSQEGRFCAWNGLQNRRHTIPTVENAAMTIYAAYKALQNKKEIPAWVSKLHLEAFSRYGSAFLKELMQFFPPDKVCDEGVVFEPNSISLTPADGVSDKGVVIEPDRTSLAERSKSRKRSRRSGSRNCSRSRSAECWAPHADSKRKARSKVLPRTSRSRSPEATTPRAILRPRSPKSPTPKAASHEQVPQGLFFSHPWGSTLGIDI